MTPPKTTLAVLAASLLGLQACQAPAGHQSDSNSVQQPAETSADRATADASFSGAIDGAQVQPGALPMDSEGLYKTNLAYLLERYDADGDDSISKAEYDRSETAWTRLDKNGDSAIDLADFESERGGGGRSRFIAQRMIGKYFQGLGDNPTPDEVTLEEVQDTFVDYDRDHNGSLAKDEFTRTYEDREQPLAGDDLYSRMIGKIDVWDSIVEAADTDENGLLASAEMDEFFKSNADDDGLWEFTEPTRRRGRGDGDDDGERTEATDGAMMGFVAPDFTLSSPDGSETVTLSSFKGSKPVALIFGSYT